MAEPKTQVFAGVSWPLLVQSDGEQPPRPWARRGKNGRAAHSRRSCRIRAGPEAHPKPIQSEFGWEMGGLPDGSKTPIQNAFGWETSLDGDGWGWMGQSAGRDDVVLDPGILHGGPGASLWALPVVWSHTACEEVRCVPDDGARCAALMPSHTAAQAVTYYL